MNSELLFAQFRLSIWDFGVDLRCVKEIIRHSKVSARPGLPSFIDGVILLRHMEVPVIDLRKRFSVSSSKESEIIISSIEGRITGLAVDRVVDIGVPATEYRKGSLNKYACGPWDSCVRSVIETDGSRIILLDLTLLLSEQELRLLDAPYESVTT